MADVNGTINVEVIYREAGGSGASPSDITGGGGGAASGGGAAADKKKNSRFLGEMTKFAKMTAASLTIGAAIKNSKIASGFLGTMAQMLGALVDVFLMPFIPLLIPVMKVMAGLIKWLVKFMEDPMGAVKEAWGNIWEFISNDLKNFGKSLFTITFWKEIWGKIDWEQILKMGVGGAGLIGLIVALSTGMSLAMGAPAFVLALSTGIAAAVGGAAAAVISAATATAAAAAGSIVTSSIGIALIPLAAATALIVAETAILAKVLNKDDMNSKERYDKALDKMGLDQRIGVLDYVKNLTENYEGSDPLMAERQKFEFIQGGGKQGDEYLPHLLRQVFGPTMQPKGASPFGPDYLQQPNDMNVTIEIIPPQGVGIYTSGTEDGYSFKADVLVTAENRKWALEG